MSKLTVVKTSYINHEEIFKLQQKYKSHEWVENLDLNHSYNIQIMTLFPVSFRHLNALLEKGSDVIVIVDVAVFADGADVIEKLADVVIDTTTPNLNPSQNNYKKNHVVAYLDDSYDVDRVFEYALEFVSGSKSKLTVIAIVDFEHDLEPNHDYVRIFDKVRAQGGYANLLNGSDAAFQLAEYVKVSNATTLIMAVPDKRKLSFTKDFHERVIEMLPFVQVVALPNNTRVKQIKNKGSILKVKSLGSDIAFSLITLSLATLISFILKALILDQMNILATYLISILLIATRVSRRSVAIISSLASVLIFNYIFVEPSFDFNFTQKAYVFTIYLMVVFAMVVFQLSYETKRNSQTLALRAFKTELLLQASLKLQTIDSVDLAYLEIGKLINKLLQTNISFYLSPIDSNQAIHVGNEKVDNPDSEIIKWVFENGKRAGANTSNFKNNKDRYYAIRYHNTIASVIRVYQTSIWSPFFEDSFLTLINELGLVIESLELQNEIMVQKQIRNNDKSKQRIVRTMSHDLRTPLTSIIGNAESLKQDTSLSLNKQEIAGSIFQEAVWLNNIVDNMLLLNRFESDKNSIPKEKYVLSEIIEEAIERMQIRFNNRTINFKDSETIVTLNANAQLLIQLFVNLIENAFKFSDVSEPVNIEVFNSDEFIKVHVSDCGVGISEENKKSIYELFYSKSTSYEDGLRGLGIGLFLCKNIMMLHDGSITINDNHPKGSVFVLEFRKGDEHNEY